MVEMCVFLCYPSRIMRHCTLRRPTYAVLLFLVVVSQCLIDAEGYVTCPRCSCFLISKQRALDQALVKRFKKSCRSTFAY
ncbi:hypothetical protein BU16DRAFT_366299 [Lophium mytilinum]|uniref:Secreted protein n=1 Tax=Lophium mytilinum TaxID=390894 RepID=A0A6A6QWM0_9PEZI|nr:hypothetical protein BU16DRAFT_366299 [Lophium mytilinum]